MTQQKEPESIKKYRNGLLAVGAGMLLDSPFFSVVGLYLLYNKASEGEEEESFTTGPGNAAVPTRAEVTYNRSILVLSLGIAVALYFYDRPIVAAAVAVVSTCIGLLIFRHAGRLEKRLDLVCAVAAFKAYVANKQLGYTVAPVSEKNERPCFRVSPLWLPRHFVVSVLPGTGTGKAGEQTKALAGADVAVQWFPTARARPAIQHNGVLIVNGGADALEAAIRGALSEMLVGEDLETT